MANVSVNVHEMHKVIEGAGIPLDCVHWNRELKIVELRFLRGATEEQKAAAQKIADEWDQEAVDAASTRSFTDLPSAEAIREAKSPKDLQAIALQLRAYIDARR
jgi:hypothetical protein